MVDVDIRTQTGGTAGTTTLHDRVFGIAPNVPVMHQVVTAQLAGIRAGTHSTKTRGEVSGGGAKPWRQKGTGRARQGSTRAPHWSGGGIAHGPKPRDYSQRTPKKMVALALRSALSDRAGEGKLVVVDELSFEKPSTKAGLTVLGALGATTGRVLVVVGRDDEAAWKSFRNLSKVDVCLPEELNTYDVLCNDWIVFTRATLATATDRLARDPKRGDLGAVAVDVAKPASTPNLGKE
jgi:large subunit ribosomal protein L4